MKAALADPSCLMVNRNAGAGTRVLIDKLLGGARPPGYANQPRSHNAVAAAVAQARADWGVAIEPVAQLYGLGFLPLAPEDYDFLLVESRRERPAVQAFLAALRDERDARRASARSACALRMTDLLLRVCDDGSRSHSSLLLSCSFAVRPRRRSCAAMAGRCARSRSRPTARRAISGSFDTSAIRWSLTRNAAEQVLRFHESAVNAVAFAAGRPHRHRRRGRPHRDLASRARRRPRACSKATPRRSSRSRSRRTAATLASASWDRTVRLWPLAGGAPRVLEGHQQNVNGVAFTPDGKSLVSAGYDADACASGRSTGGAPTIVTLPTPLNAVAVAPRRRDRRRRRRRQGLFPVAERRDCAARSRPARRRSSRSRSRRDGALVAAAGIRGSVAIIERATRKLARTLVGPGLPVWSVAFLPDNRTLLTGGTDRMVRRWDATTGEHIGAVRDGRRRTIRSPPMPAIRGAEVYRACVACHTLIAGRRQPRRARRLPASSAAGSRRCPATISPTALKKLDIVWTPETVSKLFEVGPTAYTPGTKMPEQRIGSPEDREALVEFLEKATTK